MTGQMQTVGVRGRIIVSVTLGILLGAPSAFAGPVFLGLGDLSGGSFFSRANAVSADGTTVVGASRSASGLEAFRWTSDDRMVALGDLPSGDFRSEAFDVSADGSVIAGDGRPGGLETNEAFRWQDGVMTGLGSFPPGTFTTFASAVSADGNVIVGSGAFADGFQAFRWTPKSGLVGLGDLPGGPFQSEARDASADGSVVVGSSQTGNGDGEAFRWTAETGMVGLGFLPGGGGVSNASVVSADGRVIIGISDSTAGTQTFRWTSESGMVALGTLGVAATSSDGSLLVGSQSSESGRRAMIWDELSGVRYLEDLLENDFGVDLTGWTLESARDISADGTVVVGRGINRFGETEGWVAVIPEPCTWMLLGTGVLAVAGKRRRNQANDRS